MNLQGLGSQKPSLSSRGRHILLCDFLNCLSTLRLCLFDLPLSLQVLLSSMGSIQMELLHWQTGKYGRVHIDKCRIQSVVYCNFSSMHITYLALGLVCIITYLAPWVCTAPNSSYFIWSCMLNSAIAPDLKTFCLALYLCSLCYSWVYISVCDLL